MISPPRGMWRALRVLAAYGVLTVLATWPVAPHLGSRVAGLPARDSLQYTWALWWAGYAWEHGSAPGSAYLLNYPWAAPHPLLGATAGIELMAWPLQHLVSSTQVYNLIFLASFVLCAFAMYLLAYDIIHKELPAFLAGALYAFSAHRMGQALAGHLPQLVTWWLPLCALYARRLLYARRWRDALLCGLFLGLALQVALVVSAYVVLPTVALYGICVLVARRANIDAGLLGRGTAAIGTAAAIATPTYVPFLIDAAGSGTSYSVAGSPIAHAVDLANLVVPSRYHPLWSAVTGKLLNMARLMPEIDDIEQAAYLGVIALALTILAIKGRVAGSRSSVIVISVSILLSLGPSLLVYGRDTGVPLPYAVLSKLPLLNWGRTPERYASVTSFAMALLAAQGLARLRWRPALLAIVAALAIVDHCAMWPLPEGTLSPPGLVSERADRAGALLHLPATKRQVSNLAMYYQTVNHRPIIGGYIHRELPGMRTYAKTLETAVISQAASARRPTTPTETVGLLAGLGVSEVWLHQGWNSIEWERGAAARLEAALGQPVACPPGFMVFDVPRGEVTVDMLASWPDIRLLAARAEIGPAGTAGAITLTTHWEATRRPATRLTLFAHLLGDAGERLSQYDSEPLAGNWPTTQWAPGSRVVDQRDLAVPPGALPNSAHVAVGWYESQTQEPYVASGDYEGLGAIELWLPIAPPKGIP